VLSLILDKPIFERSAFTLEEARYAAKTFVPTSSYYEALRLLEEGRVLILTGEPGVGKTSLAEHLALRFTAEGYAFHKIAEDIREAEAVFVDGIRQLFYFDDFLGSKLFSRSSILRLPTTSLSGMPGM
jgi:MoxR-like ATPase